MQNDKERLAEELRAMIPKVAAQSTDDIHMRVANGKEEEHKIESVQIEYVSMDDSVLAPGRVRIF